MKSKKTTSRKKPVKAKLKSLKASAATRRTAAMSDMESMYRPIKKPVTIRVDADVLAWFRKKGRGYQTRMNRALRRIMMEERRSS